MRTYARLEIVLMLDGHGRCEGLSKKTRESSATETKWGPYPLSTHVNFSLTFPQVLWISQGKLLAEGVFLFLFQPSDSLCLIFKHPSFFWHPFHGGRPQGRATRFAIVVKCALRNFAISLGLTRSLCSQAMGLFAACFMTTIERKDLSKKDKDRANVPIQNPSVFIKSNDDWMGVRSCRVFQGSPLFHGMKRAVLEHFKNERGALTHCLWQRCFVACDLDHFSFFGLRETQWRPSRHLRLVSKEFRISRLSMSGRRPSRSDA